MNNIKVTVIMSVYNEATNWIKSAIDSIINQTFDDFEFIIILDNPKNQNTNNVIKEYVRKDNRVRVIENETNLGLALSLNKALALSTGEYIARMDADDISMNVRIEKQVAFLDKYKDISLVGSGRIKIDEYDNEGGILIPPANTDLLKKIIRYQTIAFHPTWMFRKSILKKLTGYRPFPSAQDYDFIYRLIDNGYLVSNIQEVLLKKRITDESVSIKKSLEQQKVAEYIRTLHRRRVQNYGIDNFSIEELNSYLKVSEKEENSHKLATKYFIEAMDEKDKSRKLKFYTKLLLATLYSKHHRNSVFNTLKAKYIIKTFKGEINEV